MVIKNAKYLDFSEEKIKEGDIEITDGRISQIGKGLRDENVVDANGLYLMYGMIEPHTFLGIAEDGVGFREFDLDETSSIITPYMLPSYAIHPQDPAIKESLSWGITTACVMPGFANIIAGAGSIIKTYGDSIGELLIKEPACLKVNLTREIMSYHSEDKINTKMYAYSLLRRKLEEARNYMKRPEKKRDSSKQDLKLLSKVLKKEIPLLIHVHRREDIERAIMLKEEFRFLLILSGCEEAHLIPELIKKYEIPCILGPLMRAGKDPETKNTTFRTCKILKDYGIKFALSHAQSENPVKILRFLAMLAHKAGLSKWEALKSIASTGYEIFGLSDMGNIEEGKIANIVAFDGDPMDFRSKAVWTMIEGEIVIRGEI